jgi:DNA-binding NarL/FixJ family response regulator
MIQNNNESIKVLLADDHLIVRQGLQFLIEEVLENVHFKHVSSIKQTLENIQNESFDFLVLDAQFPDGLSLSVVSEIKKTQPDLKILIFTSFAEEHFALKFISAGANGFLSKMSEEESIKLAIRDIFEKGYYYSSLTEKLLELSKFNPSLVNPLLQLSERELEIAKLMTQGFGNLEIANSLNLKQNTVSTFKKRIFEKLNIDSIVDLIDLVKMS